MQGGRAGGGEASPMLCPDFGGALPRKPDMSGSADFVCPPNPPT